MAAAATPDSSSSSNNNNNNNANAERDTMDAAAATKPPTTTKDEDASTTTSSAAKDHDDATSESDADADSTPAEEKFESCPEFHPTMDEMRDFDAYVKRLAALGMAEVGLCKIVPPKEWAWKPDVEAARKMRVRSPIKQCVTGRAGAYSVFNLVRHDMSVADYEALANKVAIQFGVSSSPEKPKQPPRGRTTRSMRSAVDEEDLHSPEAVERRFWKSLTTTADAPLYGSDVLGTLFQGPGADELPYNLNRLPCMLKRVGVDLPGITSPMMYVGMWRSFFPFHCEDRNLFSINVMHLGEPKYWYGVPPASGPRLETLAKSIWPEETCPEFMRHKTKMVSPTRLAQAAIPFVRAVQRPGDIMITWPGSYHGGFNAGFNLAEAVNFVPPSLALDFIETMRKSGVCNCRPDSVTLNVEWLAERFANPSALCEGEGDGKRVKVDAGSFSGARSMAAVFGGHSATTAASALALKPGQTIRVSRAFLDASDPEATTTWDVVKVEAIVDGHARLHYPNTKSALDKWIPVSSSMLRAASSSSSSSSSSASSTSASPPRRHAAAVPAPSS